ncbi:MarR family winged helix-turn-helix transcriptional regulator [Amycolatopsis azurea]|uniref:MarR-family transcriptional regulator n=1 Tax=Amycolatopsis azurea DSM 43854 TaxID=1238180 RepID=M2QP62_9PSEU|nr:MarR family transcriptional regulator [Amycolatopsis azurea]EMD28451.1 MarR-family transcriptional regulator [Amycolatopsis azurea DSM 43854]
MGVVNRSSEPPGTETVAAAVAETAELLEIVFERAREASPRPLSTSQVRAVVALDHHDGLNLRALAELLGSTPPLVSRLCDRLEAVGFVDRLPSTHSRRELTLRLSDRGRAYLRDLRARRRESLESVLGKLTPEAKAALVAGLREFREAAVDF